MSRSTVAGKARKSEKDPLERYYTPAPVALGLCREWGHALRGVDVLDPFAGGGAWLAAARATGARTVAGVDVDPEAPAVLRGEAVVGDGLAAIESWRGAIVTNPPFSLTEETMKACISGLYAGRLTAVGLLVRITTLEGQKRAKLFKTCIPEEVVIAARRMPWEGPGGDALDGADNFGAAAILWGRPTVYGETRLKMGWEPGDVDGDRTLGLFGGAR